MYLYKNHFSPITKLQIILFIFILISGCDHTKEVSGEKSTIVDLTFNKNSSIPAESIVFIKAIPLETSDNFVIGTLNKLIINEGKLIVLDFMKSKSVLCFDLKGKFIKKISGIGKAAGEYLINRDFIVNQNNDGYYLFDGRQNKLLVFDHDLNFLREMKTPLHINCLIELQNDSFMVERSGEQLFYIYICDKSFDIVSEFLNRPEYQMHYNFNNPYPIKRDDYGIITYNPSFSNKIYEYRNNQFLIKYCLKDETGFPDEVFFDKNKGVHPGRLLPRFQEEGFLSFLDYYENDRFLLLKYFRGKDQNISIFNKKTSQTTTIDTSDEKLTSVLLNNVLKIDPDGSFISFILPYQLLEFKNTDQLSSIIKKSIPELNMQDNPIIIYFELSK